MSNYFIGANITYSLINTQGPSTYDEITIFLPPKSSLFSTTSFTTAVNAESSIKVLSIPGNTLTDIVAMISLNQVSILNYTNNNYINSINITNANPNFWPNQVALYFGDALYVIIEYNGVNPNKNFEVDWTVYSVSFTKNKATPLFTQVNIDQTPSTKIEILNDYFYSLAGNAISQWEITLANGTASMLYTTNISETTIVPPIDFFPGSFAVDNLIYVYDLNLGLMSFPITASLTHAATYYNITHEAAIFVQMEINNFNLLIFAKNFSLNAIYLISNETTPTYSIKPIIHCNIPISISLSASFYSLTCINSVNVYIQIFDLNTETYASLFTEIYPGYQGSFVLGLINTLQNGAGYFTNGNIISAYSLGQQGDSIWAPTYPIQAIPYADNSIPVWARIGIEFIDSITFPIYFLQFNLTASNIYHNMSQLINITLYNTADYININSSFNPNLNTFTHGEIDVFNSTFSSQLPLQAFLGNDIDFAFQINGTIGNDISASEVCEESKKILFCLENKTYEYLTIGDFVYDFDISNELIVTTNVSSAVIYNASNEFEAIYAVTWENNANVSTQCYFVRFVPGYQDYVAGCTNYSSAGEVYYLTVFSQEGCASESFEVSYATLWIE